MFALFPDKMLRKSMAGMCGATKTARDNMLRMLEDYGKKELCHLLYLGFAGFIPEIHDMKLTCPVCLTVGEKDRTGKVRHYNELWHRKEDYLLHIIPQPMAAIKLRNKNRNHPIRRCMCYNAHIRYLSTNHRELNSPVKHSYERVVS